jgi:hypothetical protein
MSERLQLFDKLAAITDNWTEHEDVPRSQQLAVKEIGRNLYDLGKEGLMREAYYHAKGSNRAASIVQAYWHGIGDWQW